MINVAAMVGAGHIADPDYSRALSSCHNVPRALIIPCVQGFAYGFLEHGEPQKEYQGAIKVCGDTVLSSEEREGCSTYIFNYFRQWYSPQKNSQICGTLSSPLREKCESLTATPRS
jgi:hypothetical protein